MSPEPNLLEPLETAGRLACVILGHTFQTSWRLTDKTRMFVFRHCKRCRMRQRGVFNTTYDIASDQLYLPHPAFPISEDYGSESEA